MKKAIIFSLIGVIAIASLLGGIKVLQIMVLIEDSENAVISPTFVSSFKVKQDQWQTSLSAISSLEAVEGLNITADQPGRVSKILFEAGAEVNAGDLLIQQSVASERAQLRSALASAKLAESNLKRIQTLYREQAVSESELDNAVSSYDSAVAEVNTIEAIIDKKSIRAPFGGRLGIRLVNLGETIDAGQPVVSLQAVSQLLANFSLPQRYLARISEQLPVQLTTDAFPNKIFSGYISAIDPTIDTATRTIKIQATLDNPESELLPGMFASVEVLLPDIEDILVIPVTAVQYATFGDSVFVLEPVEDQPDQLLARQKFVQLGEIRGDFVVVTNGLDAGQEIAGTGVFKLRNGAPVVINNSVVPEYSLNPSVSDQ